MSTNDIITTDLQNLEVADAIIELFELELNSVTTLYFHPGFDSALGEISYDGEDYIPLPVMMDGIDVSSDGASKRPTLTIANVTNVFKAALNGEGFSFEDLIGKKVTRRQTLESYLDNANYEMPKRTYVIDRVASENSTLVTFDLTAPFDVSGVRIPNRVVLGKYCSWIYQGVDNPITSGGCSWRTTNSVDHNGTQYFAYFDIEDNPLIEYAAGLTIVPFSGPHAIDSFVSHSSKYWRSEASNNSTTPSGASVLWKQVFFWTDWVVAPVSDYTVGSYVRHSNKIWKCLLTTSSIEPTSNSLYWNRVDSCGKTLNSCKSRFQFTPTADGVVSATKDTSITLPFGAFPGSVKFN